MIISNTPDVNIYNVLHFFAAARPQNPPPYSVPSQLPPSYDDAIKDSLPVPPGYVTDYRLISRKCLASITSCIFVSKVVI
jgi:hypothetical protein